MINADICELFSYQKWRSFSFCKDRLHWQNLPRMSHGIFLEAGSIWQVHGGIFLQNANLFYLRTKSSIYLTENRSWMRICLETLGWVVLMTQCPRSFQLSLLVLKMYKSTGQTDGWYRASWVEIQNLKSYLDEIKCPS